jgi:hypothetical protein
MPDAMIKHRVCNKDDNVWNMEGGIGQFVGDNIVGEER